MANVRNMWQGLVAIVTVTAAMLTPATTAFAQNIGKRENGEGKYANLTALWWQWAYAQPTFNINGTNTNPVLDTTGEFAAIGQEGGIGPGNKFFFLAGTFGGDVERNGPEGQDPVFPHLQ